MQNHESFSPMSRKSGGLDGTPPKIAFLLGLVTGIAVTGLIFFFIVFSKGSVAAVATNQPAPAPTPAAPAPSPAPTPAPSADVPAVTEADWVRGNRDAAVTLIEYSDFECPFCLRHKPSLDQLLAAYPNDVRLVYRHFPLSFHPEAQKAAEASECAGELGGNDKFWEMHDKIFDANAAGVMSVAKWKEIAGQIGLNQSEFDSCLDSGRMAAKISQQTNEGSAAGVQGTPATFVNGQLISGAVPYAQLQAAVESLK